MLQDTSMVEEEALDQDADKAVNQQDEKFAASTKYIDRMLRQKENQNLHRPPQVEKKCFSAFAIKPTPKEDRQAQKKQVHAKYNITKIGQAGGNLNPASRDNSRSNGHAPNQHVQFQQFQKRKPVEVRNSHNLKSLHTFDKVESLLNLNQ